MSSRPPTISSISGPMAANPVARSWRRGHRSASRTLRRLTPDARFATCSRPAGRMPTRLVKHILEKSFYERPTLTVAEALLGKVLVHSTPAGVTAGMIVEAEAYIGEDDPACHAAPGPTRRNAPLYGPAGRAYVYLNYGIHYLVNAVTEGEGHPAAVLIRALAPVEGARLMRKRRSPDGG